MIPRLSDSLCQSNGPPPSQGGGAPVREMDGVVFVRRGLYRNGVFRFVLSVTETYNSFNSHPIVVFQPPVFNPLIDPKASDYEMYDTTTKIALFHWCFIIVFVLLFQTGVLDLRLEPLLKEWLPDKHFLITALIFIKKVFYTKSFDDYGPLPNEEARQM